MFLTRWALAILLVATCIVTWTNIDRFQDPVGEKHVSVIYPGASDFFLVYTGTRALVMGVNPYLNDVEEFKDPWDLGYFKVKGVQLKSQYSPTHQLIYVPLALLTDDWREAGRLLFTINLVALFGLSVVTWWLLAYTLGLAGAERQSSMLLIPFFFYLLTANVGTSLGLERGDGGDILGATAVWGGIALFLRGQRFLPMFLFVTATLLKGYGALFLVGMALFCCRRQAWKPALAGGLTAIVLLFVPVMRYVPGWMLWMEWRMNLIAMHRWENQSFRYFFELLWPGMAQSAYLAIMALCLAASAAAWLKTRRALTAGDSTMTALWLCLFATTSLTTMLAYSQVSVIYNLVFMLPGLFIFFLTGARFVRACRLPDTAFPLLGALQLAIALLVFTFHLGSETLSVAAPGLMLLVLTIGGCLSGGWRSARGATVDRGPARGS